MKDRRDSTGIEEDDVIERLLREASPRPVPSAADETAVRAAVRGEWNQVTGKRRQRQRVIAYAMAATVLIGVFSVFNAFRAPQTETVEVAGIQKSFGTIYLVGESSELAETPNLVAVSSGQTVFTGDDAGIALAWNNGGSLRIDENTRVEFMSDNAVFLKSGRIYFDSLPASLAVAPALTETAGFAVHSEHGRIEHIGTQFMASAEPHGLTVSVREGQVAIDGQFHDHVASAGEQVTLQGRQTPTVLHIKSAGEQWSWLERTSPAVDVDGRSLHEFLQWASRELGLLVQYEGAAEQVAADAILVGSIDSEPSVALRQRLATAAFSYRIDEGVIYVSQSP